MNTIDNIENSPLWNKTENFKSIFLHKNSKGHIIPSVRVENWRDFIEFVSGFPKQNGWIYRGYKNSEWLLESSLSRINTDHLLQKPPQSNVIQPQLGVL